MNSNADPPDRKLIKQQKVFLYLETGRRTGQRERTFINTERLEEQPDNPKQVAS